MSRDFPKKTSCIKTADTDTDADPDWCTAPQVSEASGSNKKINHEEHEGREDPRHAVHAEDLHLRKCVDCKAAPRELL